MTWFPDLSRGEAALVLSAIALVIAASAGTLVARRWGLGAAGIVLIALTPLIPTLRIPGAFGLSSDDLLPVIGLVVLVAGIARDRRSPERAALLPGTRLQWLLVAGVVLVVAGGTISAAVNADADSSAVGLFMRGAGRFLLLAAIVWAAGATIARDARLARLSAAALVAMGTFEAVFGLIAYFFPLPGKLGLGAIQRQSILYGEIPGRIVGTLGISSNFTGAILMVTFILAIGFALAARGRGRYLWGLAAVVQLAALFLTYSRAPLGLGFVGAIALILLTSRPILILPLAGVGALAAAFTPLVTRLLADSNDRLALWTAGIRLMLDHPLGGVGPGRMLEAIKANPERYMKTESGTASNNAHNTIILAGAEMGVLAGVGSMLINVGLGLLAALAVRDGVRSRPRDPLLAAGGIAALAFLVQGMVNNLFTVGATGVVMALLAGTFLWVPRRAEGAGREAPAALPQPVS